jgi:hypothetical protein
LRIPHARTKLRAGRVAEWLMAPVLKTGVPERVSGVRIPPLPPHCLYNQLVMRRIHTFPGTFADIQVGKGSESIIQASSSGKSREAVF